MKEKSLCHVPILIERIILNLPPVLRLKEVVISIVHLTILEKNISWIFIILRAAFRTYSISLIDLKNEGNLSSIIESHAKSFAPSVLYNFLAIITDSVATDVVKNTACDQQILYCTYLPLLSVDNDRVLDSISMTIGQMIMVYNNLSYICLCYLHVERYYYICVGVHVIRYNIKHICPQKELYRNKN